jgi:hypothetical protein
MCEHFLPYVWNNWSWVMHTMSTWFWHKNWVWHSSHARSNSCSSSTTAATSAAAVGLQDGGGGTGLHNAGVNKSTMHQEAHQPKPLPPRSVHLVSARHHHHPVGWRWPVTGARTLIVGMLPTIIVVSHFSLTGVLRQWGWVRQGRVLLFLCREDDGMAGWENWCPVLCNLYRERDKAATIREPCMRSCVVGQESWMISYHQ